MGSKVILVIEFDGPDNTESVSKDTGLVGIAKVTIKVLLFDLWISRSMCRHRAISCFIRIIGFIKSHGFSPGFQLTDLLIGVLRIILCNVGFQTSRIKHRHGCFFGIDLLQDRFGKINKRIKEHL